MILMFASVQLQEQFWGSFFAVISGLILFSLTNIFMSIRNRNKNHYNYLVEMEARLNSNLVFFRPFLHVLDGIQDSIKNKSTSYNDVDTVIFASMDNPAALQDKNILKKVHIYNMANEHLSADIKSFSAMYAEMRSAVISKQITIEEFYQMFPGVGDAVSSIARNCADFLKRLIDLQTEVKLALERDKSVYFGSNWLIPMMHKVPSKNDYDKKFKKLKKIAEDISKTKIA